MPALQAAAGHEFNWRFTLDDTPLTVKWFNPNHWSFAPPVRRWKALTWRPVADPR